MIMIKFISIWVVYFIILCFNEAIEHKDLLHQIWSIALNPSKDVSRIHTINNNIPDDLTRYISDRMDIDLINRMNLYLKAPEYFNPPPRFDLNVDTLCSFYQSLYYKDKNDTIFDCYTEIYSMSIAREAHFCKNVLYMMSKSEHLLIEYSSEYHLIFQSILTLGKQKKVSLGMKKSLFLQSLPDCLMYGYLLELGMKFNQLVNLSILYDGSYSIHTKTFKPDDQLSFHNVKKLHIGLIDFASCPQNISPWFIFFLAYVFNHANQLNNLIFDSLLFGKMDLLFDAHEKQKMINSLQEIQNIKKLTLCGSDKCPISYIHFLLHDTLIGLMELEIFEIPSSWIESSTFLNDLSLASNLQVLILLPKQNHFYISWYQNFNLWKAVCWNKPFLRILDMQYHDLINTLNHVSHPHVMFLLGLLSQLNRLEIFRFSSIELFDDSLTHYYASDLLMALIKDKPNLLEFRWIGSSSINEWKWNETTWSSFLKEIKKLKSIERFIWIDNISFNQDYLLQVLHALPKEHLNVLDISRNGFDQLTRSEMKRWIDFYHTLSGTNVSLITDVAAINYYNEMMFPA